MYCYFIAWSRARLSGVIVIFAMDFFPSCSLNALPLCMSVCVCVANSRNDIFCMLNDLVNCKNVLCIWSKVFPFDRKKKLNCFYYTTHKSWPSLYFVRCTSTAEMVFHDFFYLVAFFSSFFLFCWRWGGSGVICESFWDGASMHISPFTVCPYECVCVCVCVCRCLLFLLFYAKVCTNDLAQFQYAIHTLDYTKSFGLARMQARKHWTTHEHTCLHWLYFTDEWKKKWKRAEKKEPYPYYIFT